MKGHTRKKHFCKCISWLLVIAMLLSTTTFDGGILQTLFHWNIVQTAEAASGEINDTVLLDSRIVPDSTLLAYLKEKVQEADSSIEADKITVKNLRDKVTGDLVIPSGVGNLTGLGWARNANSFDLSACTSVTGIAADEFYLCNMKSVVLPPSVKTINARAFKSCKYLQSVNLGNVTRIGEDAFADCEQLTYADAFQSVPVTLEELGNGAFQGCKALTQAFVPVITGQSAAHSVPTKLFSNCESLQYVMFMDSELETISDSAFEGTGELAFRTADGEESYGDSLPASIKVIGESAFMNSNIKALDLSNTSITEIRKTTFYYAKLTEKIVLPNTLKVIREEAFCHSDLAEIIIPNTVDTLEQKCFQFTKCLANIVLSKNIAEIPAAAFQGAGCTILVPSGEGLNFNEGNNKGMPVPVQVSFNGSTPAESALVEIGESAFNAAMLYDDSFLSGLTRLTTIGKNAFSYTILEELTIPACVSTIGEQAFHGNALLTTVTFAEGSKVTVLPDYLFGSATKYDQNCIYSDILLKKVQLPANLTSIGKYCFGYCLSLDTVGYPGKMVDQEVNFPSSLLSIDNYAFSSCSLYTQKNKRTDEDAVTNFVMIGASADGLSCEIKAAGLQNVGLQTVNIPDSVTYLGEGVFRNSVTLETLSVGKGVTEIPNSFCEGCGIYPTKETEAAYLTDDDGEQTASGPDLTERNYEPIDFIGLKNLTLPDGVLHIGKKAFQNCYALTLGMGGDLPSQLTIIDEYAFFGCKSMEKVVFSSNLQMIGKYAFAEAAQSVNETYNNGIKNYNISHQYAGLEDADFTFATSLSEIGDHAFMKTNLSKISFPTNVKTIPASVCEGCYNLTNIDGMSKQVSQIGENAFKDCFKLSTVNLPFSAEWAKTIFADTTANSNGKLTLIPLESTEEVMIPYGREMNLTLNCFKNFTSTTLTVTEASQESEDIQNDLLTHDINPYVRASRADKSQITLYGKAIGTTELKVTGKVDLYNENLNASQLMISISHNYLVTVDRVAVTDITIESKDFEENTGTKEMYLNSNNTTSAKTITAVYAPEDTTDEVKWSVDNDAVVAIQKQSAADGEASVTIVPVAPGDAVLTVGTDEVSDRCLIHVRKPASQLKLDKNSITLATGATYQLNATMSYKDGDPGSYGDSYEFKSSKEDVAIVDANGLITAVAEGTTNITARCKISGISANCSVTVKDGYKPAVTSITLSQSSLEMTKGSSQTLTAQVLPADAEQAVSWSSSNENIVSVDNGTVTAKTVGKVMITATTGNGKKATCSVTVKSYAKQLKIRANTGNTKKVYLKKGASTTLSKYFTNADCTDSFKFSCKKNKVGSVTESGSVTTKKTGKFVVTLTAYNEKKKTSQTKITVFVVKKDIKAKKVALKGKKSCKAGKSICLTASMKPAKATASVSWSSKNAAVAKVDGYGVVTGVKKGKTKITATTSSGKKKTITIKVK